MTESGSLEHVGKEIDKLIEAGWDVLENNFDPEAFRDWRQRVSRVRTLLNEDPIYKGYDGQSLG